jgi:hypothetical protein
MEKSSGVEIFILILAGPVAPSAITRSAARWSGNTRFLARAYCSDPEFGIIPVRQAFDAVSAYTSAYYAWLTIRFPRLKSPPQEI